MPQQSPQILILCVRYPDPRNTVLDQQSQQQLRILTIRLLLVLAMDKAMGLPLKVSTTTSNYGLARFAGRDYGAFIER
jgi:hypothetical protein